MKYFLPRIAKRRSIIVAKIKKRYSRVKDLKFKVPKKDETPETKRISKRLEPRIFPRLSCRFPFLIDVSEATSSGIDVPTAKIKYPIMVSPIPKLSAKIRM